jgi:Holliday junction DNA helicase RuvA
MIHYLQGKIEFIGSNFAVLEAGGFGFKIFCGPETLKKISLDRKVKFFCHLYLREETAELYGFLTAEELELFETLNNISGIGPKTAMMLASVGSLEKLKEIMEQGKLPPEIKGIGKKKMQKIFLELTGKIRELDKEKGLPVADEAENVLVSLGFSYQQARKALRQVPKELSTEAKIKQALKILGKAPTD